MDIQCACYCSRASYRKSSLHECRAPQACRVPASGEDYAIKLMAPPSSLYLCCDLVVDDLPTTSWQAYSHFLVCVMFASLCVCILSLLYHRSQMAGHGVLLLCGSQVHFVPPMSPPTHPRGLYSYPQLSCTQQESSIEPRD